MSKVQEEKLTEDQIVHIARTFILEGEREWLEQIALYKQKRLRFQIRIGGVKCEKRNNYYEAITKVKDIIFGNGEHEEEKEWKVLVDEDGEVKEASALTGKGEVVFYISLN